jgi:flavodoxin
MHAIVVYESAWGNTAAIAGAIAEGMGDGTKAYPTDEVPHEALAEADLIVAGSPVFGFGLPTEQMRKSVAEADEGADLTHPSLRSWLNSLPAGRGHSAAFETRIWWSPRGATGTIEKELERRGYPPIMKAAKFVVQGKTGPLREGEFERATAWGRALRRVAEGVDAAA